MSAKAILVELQKLGKDSYKKVLLKHGVPEPCYGVSVEEMKKIQKRVKKDYELALELYDSGVYDAMYLAGLVADDEQMTPGDLQRWVEQACRPLIGSTVPWVAAESGHGWEMARKWIEAKQELVAAAGWATLSSLVSITDDAELDLPALKKLLERVRKSIHEAPNAVRYQMNSFVICAACYVKALTETARQIGSEIGKVKVDVGETACRVPSIPEYIAKVEKRGSLGKKRKTAKC